MLPARVLLVGCGKMGGALLQGWLEQGLAPEGAVVVEPAFPGGPGGDEAGGPYVYAAIDDVSAGFVPEVVVLAVKPQVMDDVVPAYARFVGPETVFLSIAAGKTIGYFRAQLGDGAAIVRAMPNTPAAVGRGMTVCCATDGVSPAQRAACDAMMRAVGEVAWVDDEGLLDPITAVSGGGPAYVFLLIECLAQAGVDAGLPADLAMQAARVTVAGAGELVAKSAEPAATLRQNVTSPGGTTLEALNVLMADDGLQPLMTRAIAAATERSRELAG